MVQGLTAGVRVQRERDRGSCQKKAKSQITKESKRWRERQKRRSGITTLLSARVLVARLPPIDEWVKGSQERL